MKKENIIKDLMKTQKALQKQSKILPDYAQNEDELIWAAEVHAKLELINTLLEKYKN